MGSGATIGWLGLALALVVGVASPVSAAEWGGISPGISTIEIVRDRYGAPSTERRQKVEGYDTVRWVYEGGRAPVGMKRLTVEFGILTAGVYRPNLVRYFALEPKPGIFDRLTVLNGWGVPDRVGDKDGKKVFFYQSGLLVYLDAAEENAVEMVFSLPQPEPKPAAK